MYLNTLTGYDDGKREATTRWSILSIGAYIVIPAKIQK
jgi:hypothetical protein